MTNVSKEEFLLKKDVTLEEKKVLLVYTKLNVAAFLIQCFVVLLVEYFEDFSFLKLTDVLLKVDTTILLVEIAIIVLLEIFFIILPLPVFKCFGSR